MMRTRWDAINRYFLNGSCWPTFIGKADRADSTVLKPTVILAAVAGLGLLVLVGQMSAPDNGVEGTMHAVVPARLPTMSLPVSAVAVNAPVMTQAAALAAPLWRIDRTADSPLPLDKKVRERAAVDMETTAVASIAEGGAVSFSLPDGKDVEVTVEKVTHDALGNTVWRGRVRADPDSTVVVTQGSKTVFASIQTGQSSYSLEVVGNKGVIYKNPEMGDMGKPGSTDYVMPGGESASPKG